MVKVLAPVDFPDLHSVEEAAELTGLGVATIWRWINKGKIITVKLEGRTLVPKSEVERINNDKNAESGAVVTPDSKEVSGAGG